MNYNERLLFYLLRIGLGTESKYDFVFAEKPDWKFIFKMSSEQGVLAIVFDGLEKLIEKGLIDISFMKTMSIKMKLAANILKIEDRYNTQYKLANEIADKFAENNIKTIVLKGIDSSINYPIPNHRPCGDLDCFLLDNFEKGNSLLAEMGAINEESDYKHSHYIYKGLLVENHHFCTPIRGARKNKEFERILQTVINESKCTPINKTNLLSPNPLFNALFLTVHSWRHFVHENIGLRHICDWAMLLQKHCNDIDWNRFTEILNIRDRKIISFAKCVSYIAHYYMGAPMPSIFKDCKEYGALSERVLFSILTNPQKDPIRKKGFWTRKYLVLKGYMLGNWKYINFSEDNRFKVTYNLFYDYFCEKHPHL